MISHPIPRFFRGLLSLSLVAGFALLLLTIHAQDYSEEEYNQYQSIEAETDPGKKTTGPDGKTSYPMPVLLEKIYIGPSISTPILIRDCEGVREAENAVGDGQ